MKIKMYSSIISIKLNGEEDKEIFAIMFDDVEQLDKYLNGTKPLKFHRLCDNLRPASEGSIGDIDGDISYAVEDGSWSFFDDRSDDDFEHYVLNH